MWTCMRCTRVAEGGVNEIDSGETDKSHQIRKGEEQNVKPEGR